MSKVQHFCNAVNHGIAQSDDGINATKTDTTDEVGQKFHEITPLYKMKSKQVESQYLLGPPP
ncbi:hypothetical protein EVA_04849 [gut metagenome]|uniref:Uncharacterized protein n=1 Tax=gut metagenome TaxID=749906 RepID=J9H116_9ZZZZ